MNNVIDQGAGPLVVLLHGTAPEAWGRLPDLLAAHHRVLSYDRRGFGDNRRAAPAQSLSVHADDAAAVIARHGGRATLIGWSMGGVIALEAAARHPELVDGLVLLEPPLHAKRHPRPAMISAIAGAALLARAGRPEQGARRFLRWALARRDGRNDYDAMSDVWRRRLADGDDAAVVAELAQGTGEHLTADLLRGIRVPVAILRGDQSQRVFAAAAQRAAAAIPAAELVDVPGAGHAIQLDAPEAVAGQVAPLGAVSAARSS